MQWLCSPHSLMRCACTGRRIIFVHAAQKILSLHQCAHTHTHTHTYTQYTHILPHTHTHTYARLRGSPLHTREDGFPVRLLSSFPVLLPTGIRLQGSSHISTAQEFTEHTSELQSHLNLVCRL